MLEKCEQPEQDDKFKGVLLELMFDDWLSMSWKLRTINPKFAQSPQALKIFPQSKQKSTSLTYGKYSIHLPQRFLS